MTDVIVLLWHEFYEGHFLHGVYLSVPLAKAAARGIEAKDPAFHETGVWVYRKAVIGKPVDPYGQS